MRSLFNEFLFLSLIMFLKSLQMRLDLSACVLVRWARFVFAVV